MKLRTLIFLLFLVSFSLPSIGQVQSYPIKKIGDIEYYVYTVEVREGFYALKRKFGISQEDVIKYNPETKDGLKVGQQVLIPIPTTNRPATNNDNFISHTIEKKQTLYAISKIYNVSQDDIRKLNPQIGADNNLREGDILKIPTSNEVVAVVKTDGTLHISTNNTSSTQQVTQPQQNNKPVSTAYITHIVRAKETLYAISRHYNVYIEDIINHNPYLESTLHIGETIKIPQQSSYVAEKDIKTDLDIDHVFNVPDFGKGKQFRIAFLLPFMVNNLSDQSVARFSEFYAGALIAINDAKSKGISMEIYTYDTEKSEQKIQAVLQNPELKQVDLIVGPAYTNQIAAVAKFAQANRIYTLIPFSSRIPDIETNPYLFQFNPGIETDIEFATNLLLNKYKKSNVIFVRLDGIDASDNGFVWADALQRELTKRGATFNSENWKSTDVLEIGNKLNPAKENLIIFKTDKFRNVEPYLNALSSFSGYNITLFSQYSWSTQPIRQKNVFISPFTQDMNHQAATDFQKQFSRFFDWEVTITNPRYDLLGYDLTKCFIQLLEQNKSDLSNIKSSFSYPNGIQSQFKFEQKDDFSGFINQRIYLTEIEAK